MTDDRPAHEFGVTAYLASFGMVVAALSLGLLLRQVQITNVALVFLMAVLASAVFYGLWPSLFACIASAAAYNFFFLPPYHTFTIADPDNVVALFFFVVVAVITSNLAARLRAQGEAARERALMTESLYLFSRKLAEVFTLDDLLWAAAFQFAQMLSLRVVILLPDGDNLAVRAGYPPEDAVIEPDLTAARVAWQRGEPAGRGTEVHPEASRLFLPMRTSRSVVGVVGMEKDKTGPLLSHDERRLVEALADQAALAIERINLAQDMDRARLTAETERLRAALLTSISHDLRTPLASILGSATSLKSQRGVLDAKAQVELVDTIQEEAERLNRFIANLLDMTRLEAGAIEPHLELTEVGDVVGSALRRAATVLARHKVELLLDPDLPALRLDAVLFEQVLFNLLDNAGKYAPVGTHIVITGAVDGDRVNLEISDEGDGIPPSELEHVFDKFYRVHAADRKRAGTGLGLAIARGFVEAMGGTISAGNRSARRGAIFTILLPIPLKQIQDQDA